MATVSLLNWFNVFRHVQPVFYFKKKREIFLWKVHMGRLWCDVVFCLQQSEAEQESSDSQFMGLVQNLLRDPEQRINFFQVSCTFFFFSFLLLLVQNWAGNLTTYLVWRVNLNLKKGRNKTQHCMVIMTSSANEYFRVALKVLEFSTISAWFCCFVFQDVFPGDFGPTYDKAIQTLMWLFLSRLEKLLPSHNLQQVRQRYVARPY